MILIYHAGTTTNAETNASKFNSDCSYSLYVAPYSANQLRRKKGKYNI